MPVVSGDGPSGSHPHPHPDAPRAIERWNGHAGEPYGFAANLAAAKALLYPEAAEPPDLAAGADAEAAGSRHRQASQAAGSSAGR